MDGKSFQVWLAGVELLSDRQKAEALELLNGRDASAASLAAVELAVGDDRKCPHCGAGGAVANGKARRMQRYLCRSCGRTFGALTGTRLSGLHHKDRWLTFADCLAQGDTVKTSAKRCGIAVSTAFHWRHRFLEAIRTDGARLHGIVEADETFVLASWKGSRAWKRDGQSQNGAVAPKRKPRKRGGKAHKRGLSDEQVPVLIAADRSGTTVSAVLPAVTAEAIGLVLAPVLDKDALLVTDGCTSYPRCAPISASAMKSSTSPLANAHAANCTSRPSTTAIPGSKTS
jgi:Transposase and inactivated derivatives